MTRHVQRLCGQARDRECLVLAKQVVELGAVYPEFRLKIKQRPEHALNRADVLADRNLAAQLGAQIMRRRQVVRMRMGFQDPLDLQTVPANKLDDLVGVLGRSTPRLGVVIEDRVDQRTCRVAGLEHRIGHRACGWIIKRLDCRLHRGFL
jgi:hypothetical protein